MAGFTETTYKNLITQQSETQRRLFPEYTGDNLDFDVVIVGSGMGGGILADDLADNSSNKRILVIEAGSYLFPTHVYNISRFPNAAVASKYGVENFTQTGNDKSEFYIGEKPQLNLGGRSIFWSGLIPSVQPWELKFFPPNLRDRLADDLTEAGKKLNESVTLGQTARDIVEALRRDPYLAKHFDIKETPRAVHQPYLTPSGAPAREYFIEPTGVFNTAELLINQLGLKPDDPNAANRDRLQLLLNHYVESVEKKGDDPFKVQVKDVIGKRTRVITAKVVVLAAGALESPKIVRRSPVFNSLPQTAREVVGKGLTDHPTTSWIEGSVTHINNTPIPRNGHAKIIFYSKGLREDNESAIRYPFNIEMNVNHEYWHLRENDPSSPSVPIGAGQSIVEIKFSFGNLLDNTNVINLDKPYVPEIQFKNLNWMDDLSQNRFKALAGWKKSNGEVWAVLNDLIFKIFSQFQKDGNKASPVGYLGENGRGFGYGTVHHAVGTLRMPATPRLDSNDFGGPSVVNEDLMVHNLPGLYVCDMSVLPYSSSANPVRTLAALSLRLSRHLRSL